MSKKPPFSRGTPIVLLRKNLASFWKTLSRDKVRLLSFVVGFLVFLFFPSFSYYGFLHLEPQPPLVRATGFDNFRPSLYPKRIFDVTPPYVTAESVVVLDLESGVPLYEINPTERLYPASLTKLMTALVAVDYYQPTQVLTVHRLAPVEAEADMGLEVGDQVNFRGLLYGLLVPSGADAAYTIADNYPGGIENFVYAMNKKAEALNMKGTHFANPSGFDDPKNYTTAHDLALLTAVALKNDLINKVVATYGTTLADATGKKTYYLKTVNKFLGYLYGADGVKTGFTDWAGECLVSSVSRNGHRIVTVVLKSQDRFADSARLIEWAYQNYKWVNVTESGI
ncbi:D-alanyl-D-alanine carboxypeptidase [Candidatus Microgenomates bacterium]|nr:D-alanyl-D-alanine carboxypeptidase [Candidatus Microgenomates bacterium]